ncbi:MAG: invasion associated locus B family protein [Salinisphaera sp.]|nr:invasion associated locus B family protein [Salinisphaera sp.]
MVVGLLAAGAALALETGDTFGSWAVRCSTAQGSPSSRCHLFQNLIQKQAKKRVLRISVGYGQESGKPLIILDLPLGIWLPSGAQLQIDNHEPQRMPIQRCTLGGCRASANLDMDMIRRLQKGEQLTVTVYSGERQKVVLPVPLDGFGAGFRALSQ